ncbi:MAG: hypothetical protein CMJ48_04535 [Planctomycetaceae bacterium]|nr:hypothetical protein [Planctomycetaceae bacterium]
MSYRENRRALCRQLLARVLADEQELIDQREQLVSHRIGQLEELRQISDMGRVDVDRSAARRYFAGRLVAEIDMVDRRRQLVVQQIGLCRQTLVRADQDVKVLEKLKDKAKTAFDEREEKRLSRELEESWRAIHATEVSR